MTAYTSSYFLKWNDMKLECPKCKSRQIPDVSGTGSIGYLPVFNTEEDCRKFLLNSGAPKTVDVMQVVVEN